MIALAIIVGLVVLMACNQTQVIGSVIHDDPEVPVPPRNGEGGSGGTGVDPQLDQLLIIGDANPPTYDDPQYRADVDPQKPIEPPDGSGGELGPPIDPALLWVADPIAPDPAPELPVKKDPVAYVTPVYVDPQNPVPTDDERQANASAGATPPGVLEPIGPELGPPISPVDQPTDYFLPVVTKVSDPTQFSEPGDIEVAPPENPIDNWTAENTGDTECPPSVEIEYSAGAMS